MRRVISFILVLALVFSVSCVAFASRDLSPTLDCNCSYDCNCAGCEAGGVCTCGSGACDHEFVNGVCKYCGKWKIVNGNPSTGDIIMFWVMVMVVSMAAMGGLVVVYRKKFRR